MQNFLLLKFSRQFYDAVVIGSEGAVCIHAEKGPGIVYVTNNVVKCTTCKKSSCQHIITINSLITEPDRPSFLDAFTSGLETCGNRLPKNETLGTLLSWKPIPFVTPAGISDAFTQSPAERFQIEEGGCYLCDTHIITMTCESCGGLMVEKDHPSRVITRNQILHCYRYIRIHTHAKL